MKLNSLENLQFLDEGEDKVDTMYYTYKFRIMNSFGHNGSKLWRQFFAKFKNWDIFFERFAEYISQIRIVKSYKKKSDSIMVSHLKNITHSTPIPPVALKTSGVNVLFST